MTGLCVARCLIAIAVFQVFVKLDCYYLPCHDDIWSSGSQTFQPVAQREIGHFLQMGPDPVFGK